MSLESSRHTSIAERETPRKILKFSATQDLDQYLLMLWPKLFFYIYNSRYEVFVITGTRAVGKLWGDNSNSPRLKWSLIARLEGKVATVRTEHWRQQPPVNHKGMAHKELSTTARSNPLSCRSQAGIEICFWERVWGDGEIGSLVKAKKRELKRRRWPGNTAEQRSGASVAEYCAAKSGSWMSQNLLSLATPPTACLLRLMLPRCSL